MGAILRVRSKDASGTLCARLYELEGLSVEIKIRERSEDSVESAVLEDAANPISYPEFDENVLIVTRADGSEATIDANDYVSCEFEIRDEEGEIVVITDSLFVLEQGLVVAHIKPESARNKAIAALNQKKA